MPIDIPPDDFESLVADALDTIPEDLAKLIDNVAVVVDHRAPPGDLLGLYEGVPLTERDTYGAGMYMPDRITIFRRSILAACDTPEDVVDEVRTTVVHEVAHHFGIDDDRLEELGWD